MNKENKLNELLKELASYEYRCTGIPAFLLYSPDNEYWSCFYRNPRDFENPHIEAATPLEACVQMKEFLKGLNNGIPKTDR